MSTTKQTNTLPKHYGAARPITHMTSNLLNTIHRSEVQEIVGAWTVYKGNFEDEPLNVVMSFVTKLTKTKIFVIDRDGEFGPIVAMLRSDY